MRENMKPIFCNEKGMILPVALALLAIAVLFGTTAFVVTRTDIRITGNYKSGEQAHYVAEAGTEEVRARLRGGAINPISAPPPSGPRVFVDSTGDPKGGYKNPPDILVPSIQTALKYTTVVTNTSLKWGDPDGDGRNTRNPTIGEDIYLVTSYGTAANANKVVEVEVAKYPPITWGNGGSLYVEGPTDINNNTYINALGGCDGQGHQLAEDCGRSSPPNRCGDPQYAIRTTKAKGATPKPVDIDSHANVFGFGHPTAAGSSYDTVQYDLRPDLDVDAMVNGLKGAADLRLSVSNEAMKGDWGTPTPGQSLVEQGKDDVWVNDVTKASSCSENHIIYINTNGTTVTLNDHSSGCGMLLVDGNLELHGQFSWYGTIIVTGRIKSTGGDQKQITGQIFAGSGAEADLDSVFGGGTNIVYCKQAVDQTTNMALRPLVRLSWKEAM